MRDVLRDFGGNFDLPVTTDPGVEGMVLSLRGAFTPSAFLDALATRHGLVWYFDGSSIHVSPAASMRSILVDTSGMDLETMVAGLEELGVWDARYPVVRTEMTDIGMLTGPPRYVDLVENAFSMMTAEPEEPPTSRTVPGIVVMRGRAVSVWRGAAEVTPDSAPEAAAEETSTSTD
ncbi:hypothetical protein [Jannaschia sp. LMIT008]|uniref:hypothetical protein n=1 Tax=Jannaschia maritima TaxID=3032585 RepID=UPI002811FA2C|nr:hypothetical protein [Jannaschia sp. LMIT008]